MGRKKVWTERITLPLTTETLERLDSLLGEKEVRLDLIREAIEKELKRRERKS
jgi:metal-responsive CopG/Arc/MetJ family transcriptional regulator